MSQYGYLAHHGVKGQKWGVRKQVPTSGRTRSSSTKPSPDKRKAIAIAAIGAIGATALVGGGVAIAKNPQAVGRALKGIGGAFSKAPSAIKGDIWKNTARKSAKVFKQQMRKDRVAKVKSTIKSISKNTSHGILDGLKGAAKELSSREEVAKTVKVGVKQGVTGAAIAGISGGIALGVKTAVSGQRPTRQEVTSYMTKNPNKKK